MVCRLRLARPTEEAAGLSWLNCLLVLYVNSTDVDAMRLAFATVIEDMPNPVVNVKEITDVQNRVRVKENL